MIQGRSLFLKAAFGVLLFTAVLPAPTVKAQEVCTIGYEDSSHEAEDLLEVRQAAAQVRRAAPPLREERPKLR